MRTMDQMQFYIISILKFAEARVRGKFTTKILQFLERAQESINR